VARQLHGRALLIRNQRSDGGSEGEE
jgi:hypothetical protein